MEVLSCSIYVAVVSLSLFFFLLRCTPFADAQPVAGFLSIYCGHEGNYTGPNTNISWVPDDDFIHNLGEKAVDKYNNSFRVFPKTLNKSCYELPLTPNVPHLLRVSFPQPNSSGSRGFNYSVETLDMLYMEKVVFDDYYTVISENILVSEDNWVHICLIRTPECDDPSISSIALRRLKRGMYEWAKPGTILHTEERCDVGAEGWTWYLEDPFDRFWDPCDTLVSGTKTVSISNSISANNTRNLPPSEVMQTAVVSNTSDMYFYLGRSTSEKALALLYFAQLNSTGKTSFSVGINNLIRARQIDLVGNLISAKELSFPFDGTSDATVNLQSNIRGVSPIINAYEIYSLFKTHLFG